MDIKFDLVGNPEPPTMILANRNGNMLGQLKVDEKTIELSNKFIDASEFSFTMTKYVNDKLTPLWDKVVDFKLVYCKEWDCWFEIKVELDEETKTVKTVFCTQLGQAELSQIMLYNVEINTEKDIERDDYKIAILYDEDDPSASVLDRMLEKAPHYSIAYVDPTLRKIQKSFSFDGTSICDGFKDIGEEVGCLFKYPSNSDEHRKIKRDIYVYDLQQNCNECGHRGEFTDKCPKCGSTNIKYGYGEDTLIFVTSDELASSGIKLVTDTDSVKNCFKLEAGDDLMTSTVRNCNPNGTDYIWHFSDAIKEDMSNELVEKLRKYDALYKSYYNNRTIEFAKLLSQNEAKTYVLGEDYQVGDVIKFMCLHDNKSKASISYDIGSMIDGFVMFGDVEISGYHTAYLTIKEETEYIKVNEYVEVYLVLQHKVEEYNNLVSKYIGYNNDLQEIPNTIKGYPSLMNAYYNAIDLRLYLESGLMPSIEISDTNAEAQVELLTNSPLSPVAVANIGTVSLSTANSAVLSMAKAIVRSTYKVEIESSELTDNNDGTKLWMGNFAITNYSDEEDTATSGNFSVTINGDNETFIRQKIEKLLNKEDTDDLSVSGLLKKEYRVFCNELKKYALKPLISIHDACQACIDILIEQGVGNNDTWADTNNDSEVNLYESLYTPYYNKLLAIEAEMKTREDEVSLISGIYDSDGNLIVDGVQTIIEVCKQQIQSDLDFKSYLGNELWLELCSYRREDKYSNENYISDGLNNAELFERALEFFSVAENEIYKSSELQHSISTTLNNLLAIPKFKNLVKSFNVGNWIRVQVDDKIFKLRLLEYGIDYGNFDDIPVEFSDVNKIKNGVTDVQDILSKASSIATSYSYVQRQASQGAKSNSVLNNWVDNGLNATNTKIIDSYDENLLFEKNAFWCRQYDPITDTYSDEQIKIVNSTIAITDDNWATTKTAIGKYYYFDPETKELKSAYGVNGETIIGKLFLGENMSIQNESGNMRFDGNGLNISNGTNTVTINPNDAEIMNITTNGKEKVFNVNEDGDLSINGNIMARSLQLESGVKIDSGVITNLANVATSGSYNDLVNTPSLSSVATSGSYNDLINKPTKLSNFENDGIFITKDANNLTNYYKKTEVDNLLDSKTDTADLSEVATSGSYNDLVDINELKNWVLEQIRLAIS